MSNEEATPWKRHQRLILVLLGLVAATVYLLSWASDMASYWLQFAIPGVSDITITLTTIAIARWIIRRVEWHWHQVTKDSTSSWQHGQLKTVIVQNCIALVLSALTILGIAWVIFMIVVG